MRVEPLGQVERPELRGPDGAVQVAEGLEILLVEVERVDLDSLLDRDEVAIADLAGEDFPWVGLQRLFPLVAVDELPERRLDLLRCVPDARAGALLRGRGTLGVLPEEPLLAGDLDVPGVLRLPVPGLAVIHGLTSWLWL
jgi:hypothetical protein